LRVPFSGAAERASITFFSAKASLGDLAQKILRGSRFQTLVETTEGPTSHPTLIGAAPV
jgi:hypothetical protein